MNTRISILAALAVTSLALAGCAASPTASNESAAFNEADVTFLTDMIPHHAQALLMVDMTDGRELTPEFAELTTGIEAAQGPEIDQMSAWLDEWGYDVPDATSHMGMMTDDNGMGMMTDDDVESLGGMMGGSFEDMWMVMMIEHHEGAIDMSHTELAEGVSTDARDLAERIIAAQEAEIALMEELLADKG
jgi:uncharacterized protein (DUF305 family)